MARKPVRSSRSETRRRLPPPAPMPSWDDAIDRAVAQMLTSPYPLRRASAARLIVDAPPDAPIRH